MWGIHGHLAAVPVVLRGSVGLSGSLQQFLWGLRYILIVSVEFGDPGGLGNTFLLDLCDLGAMSI